MSKPVPPPPPHPTGQVKCKTGTGEYVQADVALAPVCRSESHSVAADSGGGRTASRGRPSPCLPLHAQRDGGPVSSSGAHGDLQKLPPWLWERGNGGA